MLARGLRALLPVDGFAAGQILSVACFFFAGILFAAEGRRRLGQRGSRHALLFLLLFPTAFFLLAVYSESLFLLLALAAFDRVRRGRAGAAAILGLLAGMTRMTALALAAPLAIEAFSAARDGRLRALSDRRARNHALLVGLAPVAGVLLWVLGAGLAAGEPGLYFRVQEAWHRSSSPFVGAWHFFMRPFDSTWRGEALEHPARFLDYVYFLLIAAIAVFQARRRRYSDAAWTAGALLLPVGTGISASLSRYVLVVYPAFYALAELFEYRPRLRLAWWIASAALLLAGEAAFVHWRWVA